MLLRRRPRPFRLRQPPAPSGAPRSRLPAPLSPPLSQSPRQPSATSPARSHSASDGVLLATVCATEADKMPNSDSDEAPSWFKSYLNEFRTMQSSVTEFQASILQRMGNVEKELASQRALAAQRDETLRSEMRAEFSTKIDAEINSLRAEVTGSAHLAAPSPMPSHESFEVLVTGIPQSMKSDDSELIKMLLSFLGISHLLSFVVASRPWLESRSSDANSANNIRHRGIVFGCSSTYIRDKITGAAGRLRDARASSIFREGGDAKIFLRALWQKSVYELYRKAIIRCKAINYTHPSVRNDIVWVRATNNDALVPIRTEAELLSLPHHGA